MPPTECSRYLSSMTHQALKHGGWISLSESQFNTRPLGCRRIGKVLVHIIPQIALLQLMELYVYELFGLPCRLYSLNAFNWNSAQSPMQWYKSELNSMRQNINELSSDLQHPLTFIRYGNPRCLLLLTALIVWAHEITVILGVTLS